ncbi:hypothetical protein [Dactylosporangium sp. CA-233914]|uniref:hypothetical protein n=1 Tax=Dactylosporangium sp. CA-233914 TaxID=3239934 RepID=UPI003D8A10AB
MPDEVGAPAQYGPRVRAIGAFLVGYQHLPDERAREALADLLGVGMSRAPCSPCSLAPATG